ncbi:MAG TPA: ribosome small subunit-dependent GTPase A [Candidatus Wallbacteria bacterium]|nr:MAG: putative ribosome biogenesis GTPase RsgA [bacterium ADurb.Bin243]HOD41455.1 ribosome small subunit-dependent GTPase A [Candidatus Wallbacteria bacterium]HPG59161.1 ribosome small subunit-dependent GTPase A [Candidatus Wallbacteria bacterium]
MNNKYTIDQLGWNDFFEANMASLKPEDGQIPARVSAEHKGMYKVLCEHGELSAEITGRLRFDAAGRSDFPAVGDFVIITARPAEGSATIQELLPRRTKFSRMAAGSYCDEQIVAANLDVVFIVMSLNADFNLRRVERYLTLAFESGAKPVVILNKADLCDDIESKTLQAESSCPGADVIAVSAVSGYGFDGLRKHLKPGVSVSFLGSSGVGKSSIINRLLGRDALKINAIREFDDRGRHTTTHRELFVLESGAMVIDTPGMRELQLVESSDGLADAFTEIEEAAQNCRYRDCRHENEPGCAVNEAVAAGKIDEKRLVNFKKMRREIERFEIRNDARLKREEEKKWKQIAKAIKNYSKETRYKF